MWAPDSKRLLLVGKPDTKEAASISVDWWVVPLDNGPLVKTSALDSFNSQNLKPPLEHDWITPIGWLPGQNRILFSATQGDTTNLWEIAVSPAGKVIAPATRRTFTTSLDLHASVIGQANGAARRMFFQACLVT